MPTISRAMSEKTTIKSFIHEKTREYKIRTGFSFSFYYPIDSSRATFFFYCLGLMFFCIPLTLSCNVLALLQGRNRRKRRLIYSDSKNSFFLFFQRKEARVIQRNKCFSHHQLLATILLFLFAAVEGVQSVDTTSFHWFQQQQKKKKKTMNHSAGNYEMSCVRFPPCFHGSIFRRPTSSPFSIYIYKIFSHFVAFHFD